MSRPEPIAVIGSACRFTSGANTPSRLWDLIGEPRDARETLKTHTSLPYFLDEDPMDFDGNLFNIPAAEIETIEPQQRVLLETVYDSLCAAGQTIEDLRSSSTAVVVGMTMGDGRTSGKIHRNLEASVTRSKNIGAAAGVSRSVVSDRVSHSFDWRGPSMTVDTEGSSSLVAVHLAIQSLRNGESELAVAAGVNLFGSATYSTDSNGSAHGEGIAAVILKSLSAALRDGDHIECLIRATGVNQDGKPDSTVTSAMAQAALIRETYARAGLDLNKPTDRPQFLHVHGTSAGGKQEAEVIARAFYADDQSSDDKLFFGSIRTVIGHTEGTAGLASLLGTSLALQHGTLPSTILKPEIKSLDAGPAQPWPRLLPGQPRRASINSFGFGGTNAHAIIEAFSPGLHTVPINNTIPLFTPLPISAASESSLRSLVSTYLTHLSCHEVSLRDFAYTLQHRRSTHNHRVFIAPSTQTEAVAQLKNLLAEDTIGAQYGSVSNPSVLGVFTGEDAVWPRMGARLLEVSPLVARRFAELDSALQNVPRQEDRPAFSLTEELLKGEKESRLGEPVVSQLLCTAVQIVLVDLLQAAGVNFRVVVGHSAGEISAAYAAGFFSRTEAIRIAYYRGLSLENTSSSQYIDALQPPRTTTRSGDCSVWYSSVHTGRVMTPADLTAQYWVSKPTDVDQFAAAVTVAATHSGPFNLAVEVGPRPVLKGATLDAVQKTNGGGRIPYTSTLSRNGDDVTDLAITLGLIWSHLGPRSVQFEALELTLSGGSPSSPPRRFVPNLPSYPFDHSRTVPAIASVVADHDSTSNSQLHPLLGKLQTQQPASGKLEWRNVIKPGETAWLSGHKLQDQIVVPAAAFVSMVAEAVRGLAAAAGSGEEVVVITIEDLNFDAGITINDNTAGVEIVFTVNIDEQDNEGARARFSCSSYPIDDSSQPPVVNAHGVVSAVFSEPAADYLHHADTEDWNLGEVDVERFYDHLSGLGYGYGPPFHGITSIRRRNGYALGTLENQAGLGWQDQDILVHPSLVDTAFQSSFAAFASPDDGRLWTVYVPASIKKITINPALARKSGGEMYPWEAVVTNYKDTHAFADVNVFSQNNTHTFVQIEGIELRPLVPGRPEDDIPVFSRLEYEIDRPDGDLAAAENAEIDAGFESANALLARMVAQVSHRYSDANILDLGAGQGNATTDILDALGLGFGTYTYTDASSALFGGAKDRFREFAGRVVYREYDIADAPAVQGFNEGYYDVVVASQVSHSAAQQEEVVANVRRLLKPGGYLIVAEPLDSTNSEDTAVPSLADWDALLFDAGFGGIDTEVSQSQYAVFVAQAIDDRVSFLRAPLTTPLATRLPDLAIIGGHTLPVQRLVRGLKSLLRTRVDKITVIPTIEAVTESALAEGTAVIAISELDGPVFRDISSGQLDGLKVLWRRASTVLWTTKGARTENAHAYMTHGLCRAVNQEYPELAVQVLDLEVLDTKTAELLSEEFLRADALQRWSKEGVDSNALLWSSEPEVYLEAGKRLIPRLHNFGDANDRYNTARRVVTKAVQPQTTDVELVGGADDGSYTLKTPSPLRLTPQSPGSTIRVRVSHILLQTLKLPHGGRAFLGTGTNETTGETLLFLSETAKSLATIPTEWTTPISGADPTKTLTAVAADIVASTLLQSAHPGSAILVHEPDALVTSALVQKGSRTNVNVVITTSSAETAANNTWHHVHSKLSSRLVAKILPARLSMFVDLSQSVNSTQAGKLLAQSLPPTCASLGVEDVFGNAAEIPEWLSAETLSKTLSQAWTTVQPTLDSISPREIVPLQDVPSHFILGSSLTIVDLASSLAASALINAKLTSIDDGLIFRSDRTYWLVDMAEGLDQELCRWMADHGARHIVLSSGQPKMLHPGFVGSLGLNTAVKTIAVDTTDLDSVAAVRKEIEGSMPPIAGVTIGATISDESPFDSLSFESLNRALQPKITGTQNLDEVFHDTPLDFFVVFSSGVGGTGSVGHSHDIAANLYVTAVALQRKHRGLAGSAVGLGLSGDNEFVRPSGTEVQQQFAEAILVGKPECEEVAEIVTQPRRITRRVFSRMALEVEPKVKIQPVLAPISIPVPDPIRTSAQTLVEASLLVNPQIDDRRGSIPSSNASSDGSHDHDHSGPTTPPRLARTPEVLLTELNSPLSSLSSVSAEELEDRAKAEGVETNTESISVKDKLEMEHVENVEPAPDVAVEQTPAPVAPAVVPQEYTAPLSYAQAGIWQLQSQPEHTTTFNMSAMFKLTGHIDIPRLERAVQTLAHRHEILRTRYIVSDSAGAKQIPVQSVLYDVQEAPMKLVHKQIAIEEEAQAELQAMQTRKWDLGLWETVQVHLLSLGSHAHFLIAGGQHLSLDGPSFKILFSDLEAAYMGRPLAPLPEKRQYRAFAQAQRGQLKGGAFKNGLKELQDIIDRNRQPIQPFAFAKSQTRPATDTFSQVEALACLDRDTTNKLRSFARKNRASLLHLHLAALQGLVFGLLSETDDIIIGMTDAGRADRFAGSLGLFLNLVPVHLKRGSSSKVSALIQESRDAAISALKRSHVPWSVVLEELKVTRAGTHAPVFQLLVDYRQAIHERSTFGGCKVGDELFVDARNQYDLTLGILDHPQGGSSLTLRLAAGLYTAENAQLLMRAVVGVLETFATGVDGEVSSLPTYAPPKDIEAGLDNTEKGPETNQINLERPLALSHGIEDIAQSKGSSINAIALSTKGPVFDWAEETAVPEVVTKLGREAGSAPVIPREKPLTIVLTGSTGYLGRRVLAQLLSNPQVEAIRCLVRNVSAARGSSSRASANSKIQLVQADLAQPNLGLSLEAFTAISEGASAIVHLAADRAVTEKYAKLRAANLHGVHEMTRLALLAGGVPLHFVSSGAVSDYSNGHALPPTDGTDGYVASKWAAETFLRNAAPLGVKAYVHRLLSLSGASAKMAEDHGLLGQLLRLTRRVGMRPDFSTFSGHVDVATADKLVGDLTASIFESVFGDENNLNRSSSVGDDVIVVEHAAKQRLPLEGFARVMEEKTFQRLPAKDCLAWLGGIRRAGFDRAVMGQQLVIRSRGAELVSRR